MVWARACLELAGGGTLGGRCQASCDLSAEALPAGVPGGSAVSGPQRTLGSTHFHKVCGPKMSTESWRLGRERHLTRNLLLCLNSCAVLKSVYKQEKESCRKPYIHLGILLTSLSKV